MNRVGVSGGSKADAALADIARRLGDKGGFVRVGFLENAKYPAGKDGLAGQSVAMVAAVQNFGSPARGIPPRPFFTNTVKDGAETWGPKLGKLLVQNNYDVPKCLELMGEVIKAEIEQSILDTTTPPLAAATIKRKGFDKPLEDTKHMLNSVDYEVETG